MTRKDKVKHFFGYPFYIMSHPFDGFYDMKFAKKGRVGFIFFAVFFLCISQAIQETYTHYAISGNLPGTFNTVHLFYQITGFFVLFCVANWSVSSIMNGEGKFVEIAMATAYALTPLLVTIIPVTIISRALAYEESAFYGILNGIAIFYFIVLEFVGILTVHNYTVMKTVGTFLLTVCAIVIIIFLAVLLFTLMQQVQVFVSGIITELRYRT